MGKERKEGMWEVSPYNFARDIRADMNLPRKVTVNDMVLRAGTQLGGVFLRSEDIVEVARRLDDAGIPMIEMHHNYLEEMRAMKKMGLRLKIQSLVHPNSLLTREACRHEVDLFVDSGADIICFAFAIFDFNRVLHESVAGRKKSHEEALEEAAEAVRYAKSKKAKVSCNMLDFPRTPLATLQADAKTLVEAGADIIRIDDIGGSCMPAACKYYVRALKQVIPNTPIATLLHNSFGLATACQLAALEGGAEILDVSINGLSDHGFVSNLAELVAILEILYGYDTGIRLEKLKGLSDFVADVYGLPTPPFLPVVGERSFAGAGELVYTLLERGGSKFSIYSFAPEMFGNKAFVTLGQYSGVNTIRRKARELGLGEIPDAVAAKVVDKVQSELRARRRILSDDVFREMVRSASARAGH